MNARGGGGHIRKENAARIQGRANGSVTTALSALAQMNDHLQAQGHLCSILESLADRLPDKLDSQECLHVARTIYPIVRRAHEFEEQKLFPLLEERFASDASLKEAIHRLRFEHWEDESFAEEIADSLLNFVRDRAKANTEALGYMLRGFFEGLRRHLAFEREHICPILRNLDNGHAAV